jgi:phosphate transport system substrate-binding protein
MKNRIVYILLSAITLTLPSNTNAQTKSKELEGEISLSGAFALYPLAVKWADEFKKLHPKVKIDISAGGAGKGITDALSKVVDLGMVSREIHPEEIKKGAFAIAVAKDAVVPTINSKNPKLKELLEKGLNKEVAKKIFVSAEYTTWNKILGVAGNIPLHVYNRSDACGAGETWGAFLGKKQEDLKGTGVFGDPGVASAIQKDPLAIGYNNISYVYDLKTKQPNPGIVPLPIDVNNNGKIDEDERFYDNLSLLIRAIAGGKYPSPPARYLYFVSNGKPSKAVVIEFIKFVLSKGQSYNNQLGYIGLNKQKLNVNLEKLK